MLVARILPWTRCFCNVDLFRVARSWTGGVQMKSSMTFIRGNRCIDREKDTFKSHEVKRLKECALALSQKGCVINPINYNFFQFYHRKY